MLSDAFTELFVATGATVSVRPPPLWKTVFLIIIPLHVWSSMSLSYMCLIVVFFDSYSCVVWLYLFVVIIIERVMYIWEDRKLLCVTLCYNVHLIYPVYHISHVSHI